MSSSATLEQQVRSFLTPQRKEELRVFLQLIQKNPQLLHVSELKFFKDFLTNFNANIPEPQQKPAEEKAEVDSDAEMEEPSKPAAAAAEPPKPTAAEPPRPPMPKDEELMEADAELAPLVIDRSREVTEADMDAANEIKSRAMAAENDEEAVKLLDQAIEKNPKSAILYAVRAATLLKMKKPNAAIRDCTAAIGLNPDSAKPYKVRGRAWRHLGQYAKAKPDLQLGNRLDWDEATYQVQKFVEARLADVEAVEKLEAARRRDQEIADRERKAQEELERRKRAAEEARKKQEEEDDAMPDMESMPGMEGMPNMGGMPGGMPAGGIPAGMSSLFSDPEIMAALSDPATSSKLLGLLSGKNPAAFAEAAKDPKLAKIIEKIAKAAGKK